MINDAVVKLGLLVASATLQLSNGAGTNSDLQVQIPQSLRKEGGYDHREALFGLPPYGGAIEEKVYYAASTMCIPDAEYTRGGFPERPIGDDGEMGHMVAPFILMLDRGDCTFVKKVRNAQRAGATAVLIADDSCLCAAGDACVPDDEDAKCEPKEPIMADDGSGLDITIPSFLVFKQEADPIKKALQDNQPVRARMSWTLPESDDRVEYQLWTTPTDLVSRPLQRNFRVIAEALGEHASFTPHMYFYDGIAAGCRDFHGDNQCSSLCTNNGRYCLSDPDNNLQSGISGADVVTESLRRTCIWREYGKDGMGLAWWNYVDEFLFRCDKDHFANEQCVKDAMEHAAIDWYKVQSCMDDAGGLKADDTNEVLESELTAREANGVVILPSFYVNGSPLRGALTTSEVFEAICAGFAHGSQPAVCKTCRTCSDAVECINNGKCPGSIYDPGNGISMSVFLSSLLALSICFGCIGLVQWQRSQRQMRAQVRGIMAEYMPIDENTKTETLGFDEDDQDLS